MANIIVRDPFEAAYRDFVRLGGSRARFFAPRPLSRPVTLRSHGTLPLDISEKDGALIVRASLPGFATEEVEVELDGGVLSISATRADEQQAEDERHYRRERRSGSLSRRIALPDAVADAEVDAELKDGVLTLTIPIPEASRPKQIEVHSSQ